MEHTALLTWFEKFWTYKFNPVEDIALELNWVLVWKTRIKWVVLPSVYDSFSVLKNTIIDTNPKMIIQMGLSSSVWWIRLETTAKNELHSEYPDNSWTFYSEQEWVKIIDDWSEKLLLNYDSSQIRDKISRVIDSKVEISNDADAFICNDLMYRTADFLKKQKSEIMHIFIHIPWTSKYQDKIELKKWKITIPEIDAINWIWIIIDSQHWK